MRTDVSLCDSVIEFLLRNLLAFDNALDDLVVIYDGLEGADGNARGQRKYVLHVAIDWSGRIVILYNLCDSVHVQDLVVASGLNKRIVVSYCAPDGD
jgi:hypothetical protein